jgi:heat shock protein HslJ
MTAGDRMTNRRLGYAALLAALVPMASLMASPAEAQRRGRQQPQEQQQQIPSAQQEKSFPVGASWAASSLNGKPISDRRATFLIDANLRGTGFGGCNTFSAAAYPLRQQGLAVGPLALTKRACDKGLLDFERAYLTALRAARNWDLVDGKLIVKGAAGELRFERGL